MEPWDWKLGTGNLMTGGGVRVTGEGFWALGGSPPNGGGEVGRPGCPCPKDSVSGHFFVAWSL